MEGTHTGLKFSIVKRISAIPAQDWDNLFGKGLIESYGYLKNLEEGGAEEFSFGYLLGKRNDTIVFILPFFSVDFSLAMLLPGPLRKLAGRFNRWLRMKVLFPGSPTTEGFSMGLSPDEEFDVVLGKALEKLEAFSKEEKIAALAFYNLPPQYRKLAAYLKQKKFLKLETLPTTALTIQAACLEEYIKGLGKNTRKDLKKKLRRSAELAQLRTEPREDVSDIIDTIYRLYLDNFNDADVHFETLTKKFFLDIGKNMPGVAKYFITYDGEKIVAFNLCLIKDGTFIDKFIGFDYNVAHKYHLYYTTFCHNIEWCITHGLKVYQPGFSDYHPKVRLGAKLIPLDIYVKIFNPLLNALIRLAKPLIEPKNMDPVLRQIEKKKGKVNLEETS
ncbi:MAG: GNAT family N-acetyltransferase [Candidatus Omnitrophica bacterium]|nr:GNAT family N-acetyltransferase [Candidatus Omnitrophota bacterium]